MSSQGYSTFLAFGSGCAAGLTTRMYSAASAAGAPLTSSTKGTNVRCSCDFRKNGVIAIWMSAGARLAGHDAVHELDDLLDFLLFLLAALLGIGFGRLRERESAREGNRDGECNHATNDHHQFS